MTLNILVAPSGFKECISATAAAKAIVAGVRRAMPEACISAVPMADGGEGFTETLVEATGGMRHACCVSDPLGRPVPATLGLIGDPGERTAVIEIAQAAGLRLLRPDERNMLRASSLGVGQLIRVALDLGARRILIGCGDSGVNDGGAGLAQALGARFFDHEGRELGGTPDDLLRLARIDISGLDRRLGTTRIDVAVNWQNALLGPRGVTRVYGPQKGVSPDQVEKLEAALATYARCIREATGIDVATESGAGASGGIGAALAGLCGARLHPRLDIVKQVFAFDARLRDADLVITAEGTLDWQTPLGKIPAEIGRCAKALGIPVLVLAGAAGEGAEASLAHGITAFQSVVRGPCAREDSMKNAATLLETAAEQTMRTFVAGLKVGRRRAMAKISAPGPAPMAPTLGCIARDNATTFPDKKRKSMSRINALA
mgnify:CR=1 FL=1